jgi:hypothetical protein
MDQDLVGHDLEKQRRHETEQLQEERRQEDLAEETAIFLHRLQEPSDIEAAAQLAE